MNGFISPVFSAGSFIPEDLYTFELNMEDSSLSELPEDWYYLRVIQKNRQGAWSSPVWVRSIQNYKTK